MTITNPGYFQLGSRKIADLARPGEYDFHRAFLKSSNTYFIQFGLETGLERILNMGARFHLGESADLPTRQNERGRFPTAESIRRQRTRGDVWTDGDTANLCIGQGEIAVTPLQMAIMTAAIANGGKVFRPRLVQYLESIDESGERSITRRFPPLLRSELGVQPRNLEIIRDGMRADVEDSVEGTGRQAEVPGLDVCGKTGTAEVKQGQVVIDRITWFTSFAPYKDPRYVVLIVVESGASGGGTCAPMAHMIYRAIQERENPKGKPKQESLAAAQN